MVSDILLISCYELGHQPLSLAWPAAYLRDAGYEIVTCDLSVEPFPTEDAKTASFVAISTPMHTAMRLGVEASRHVRQVNPDAHICFFGLYAWLNADYLLTANSAVESRLADSVIAGEYEKPLVQLVKALENGWDLTLIEGLSTISQKKSPRMVRQGFTVPDRSRLPSLNQYAHFIENGRQVIAGYTEASRGCLHTCLHCPVVPVYQGRFFVVPIDIVLADIRQQVSAGAQHFTFGDPDFLNGPGQVLKILRAMHQEFPDVTFDFTTKVEHIIQKADLFPEFKELGAAFVISAFEATSDGVLKHLDKGHTLADLDQAMDILAGVKLPVQPTWVPFTPWTSLADYLHFLGWVRAKGLVEHIAPVQYSIRLLIPPGSALLENNGPYDWLGRFEPENFVYHWRHPDPRMDQLWASIGSILENASDDQWQVFSEIERMAYAAAGIRAPGEYPIAKQAARPPRLTEDWFC